MTVIRNQQKEVFRMVDSKLLEHRIKELGLKKWYLAEQMGLSPYGMQKKIDGVNEFKASEIFKMCELLKIEDSDTRDAIFFAVKGD